MNRWVHRNEKYGRSFMAGMPASSLSITIPAMARLPAAWATATKPSAISLALEDGAFLARLLRRKGEVRIRLHSTDAFEQMVSWNVIADLPGTAEPGDRHARLPLRRP